MPRTSKHTPYEKQSIRAPQFGRRGIKSPSTGQSAMPPIGDVVLMKTINIWADPFFQPRVDEYWDGFPLAYLDRITSKKHLIMLGRALDQCPAHVKKGIERTTNRTLDELLKINTPDA